jgi:hypothetical protein
VPAISEVSNSAQNAEQATKTPDNGKQRRTTVNNSEQRQFTLLSVFGKWKILMRKRKECEGGVRVAAKY